jgi:hypothetical protein
MERVRMKLCAECGQKIPGDSPAKFCDACKLLLEERAFDLAAEELHRAGDEWAHRPRVEPRPQPSLMSRATVISILSVQAATVVIVFALALKAIRWAVS